MLVYIIEMRSVLVLFFLFFGNYLGNQLYKQIRKREYEYNRNYVKYCMEHSHLRIQRIGEHLGKQTAESNRTF